MATTEASGDDDEWARQAYHNPDLVAAVLISFRLWCPEADGDERPSTSAPPSVCSLEWGTRRKRSRLQIPRVFPLTQEEEEEERKISAATAEAEAEETNRKEKKRRASPQSPLEGYSSASASGGEEGAKTGRSAGVSIAGPEERRNELQRVSHPRALWGISRQGHQIQRLAVLRCRCFAAGSGGGGGGGDEPARTDGFLLHPTAIAEKNDESRAAGRANVAAGREGETCRGGFFFSMSILLWFSNPPPPPPLKVFGAAEGGERQTKAKSSAVYYHEKLYKALFSLTDMETLEDRPWQPCWLLLSPSKQQMNGKSEISLELQRGSRMSLLLALKPCLSLRKLPEPPVNNHHTIKAVQQLVAPGRKDFIELPDLNDLPTDC
ncbi:hypothetical protein ZIOFF_035778 [Zingiber officinale]|uniref:Uncharacterized protein n=1 Tax=Zingiber officinale TaxID=94328 RepID=A0A8J5G9M4_ZINOF|nr:hypothetical protein ZIOFF_035778 [Zingiber officinale]